MANHNYLIFISYRGSDEMWGTEFVHKCMTVAFGADVVFKAGNAIREGDKFPAALRRNAASCPVMLVCVGPNWLTATAPDGSRRLDAPGDWVRKEIEISREAGNRVVPLLLGDPVKVPVPDQKLLPESIKDMFDNQARHLVPGRDLELTVPRLIDSLVERVPQLAERHCAQSGATGQAPPPVDPASSTKNTARKAKQILQSGANSTNYQSGKKLNPGKRKD